MPEVSQVEGDLNSRGAGGGVEVGFVDAGVAVGVVEGALDGGVVFGGVAEGFAVVPGEGGELGADFFEGIGETNLVLQPPAATSRDGVLGGNSLFPGAYLYTQGDKLEWRL